MRRLVTDNYHSILSALDNVPPGLWGADLGGLVGLGSGLHPTLRRMIERRWVYVADTRDREAFKGGAHENRYRITDLGRAARSYARAERNL